MKDVSINIAVVVLDFVHNDEAADIDYFADLEVTKYCKSYNHVDLVAADADWAAKSIVVDTLPVHASNAVVVIDSKHDTVPAVDAEHVAVTLAYLEAMIAADNHCMDHWLDHLAVTDSECVSCAAVAVVKYSNDSSGADGCVPIAVPYTDVHLLHALAAIDSHCNAMADNCHYSVENALVVAADADTDCNAVMRHNVEILNSAVLVAVVDHIAANLHLHDAVLVLDIDDTHADASLDSDADFHHDLHSQHVAQAIHVALALAFPLLSAAVAS